MTTGTGQDRIYGEAFAHIVLGNGVGKVLYHADAVAA